MGAGRSRRLPALVRLALLGVGIVGSMVQVIARPDSIRAQPPVTFSIAPVVLFLGVVGMLFVIGIQAVNPWSAKVWSRPSWSENPLSMRQPCQFFHLCAWFMAASGVAGAVTDVIVNHTLHPEYAVIAASGFGIRIGVSLAVVTFSWKFAVDRGHPPGAD